ncbi:MAG: nitroreductase [Gordonibacter sp.]|uniref:nitroreductase n=1 Tax=Gordonibacter sp. TaxID=1968902 RepID=UPI002FC8F66D
METFEAIFGRRSIRDYSDKQVPVDVVRKICNAGLFAASGNGMQSTIVVAVSDRGVRERMSALNAAVRGQQSDPFYGAPVVLTVLAKVDTGTYLQDGSLTMATLMLAARAEGLGSCWVHCAKEQFEGEEGQAFYDELGIPEGYVGIGNCIVGYPAEGFPKADARHEGRMIEIA